MTPSPEQEAICRHVADANAPNLVVEASPGSGKTTTIAMAARRLPLGKLYVALCFAKANAEDFQRKLPGNVVASTSHSLALGALRRAHPEVKVSADKVKNIIKGMTRYVPWEQQTAVLKLVSLAKQSTNFSPTADELEELAVDFALDITDAGIDAAQAVLVASDATTDVVDFDDMLRFADRDPAVRFPTYGMIFLDEAQDTNEIQRALLAKMAGGTSRVCAVGDPFQAIYGFRGASADALALLTEELSATVLPLSVSYRCASAVCAEARRVLTLNKFLPR